MTFQKEAATIKSSKIKKLLFVGAKAFVRLANDNTPFIVYATPTSEDIYNLINKYSGAV